MYTSNLPNGEAKFWLEPRIELAHNYHLSEKDLRQKRFRELIEENKELILDAWNSHFPS